MFIYVNELKPLRIFGNDFSFIFFVWVITFLHKGVLFSIGKTSVVGLWHFFAFLEFGWDGGVWVGWVSTARMQNTNS